MALNSKTTVDSALLQGSDFVTAYAFQTTEGQLNSPLNLTDVRRGSGKVRVNKAYTEGNEIPQDRQAVEQLQDTDETVLELSSGVSKQSVQFAIAALCGGDETQVSVTAATIAADANGFVASSGTPFADLNVGDGFWISGYTDSTIDGFYIVGVKNSGADIETTIAPVGTHCQTTVCKTDAQ